MFFMLEMIDNVFNEKRTWKTFYTSITINKTHHHLIIIIITLVITANTNNIMKKKIMEKS